MINISNRFVITKLPQYSMILFIFLNIIDMFLYTRGNINDPKPKFNASKLDAAQFIINEINKNSGNKIWKISTKKKT